MHGTGMRAGRNGYMFSMRMIPQDVQRNTQHLWAAVLDLQNGEHGCALAATVQLVVPQAFGWERTRELLKTRTEGRAPAPALRWDEARAGMVLTLERTCRAQSQSGPAALRMLKAQSERCARIGTAMDALAARWDSAWRFETLHKAVRTLFEPESDTAG